MSYQIVGANIDTWLINVKGKLPDGLADELDFLKEASQEADEDIPTRWAFAGETLFIKPQEQVKRVVQPCQVAPRSPDVVLPCCTCLACPPEPLRNP
jgi:hypothetical protein